MNNNPAHPIYDVIIAGAGPVGLFLACELALAGCSVLILEKAGDPRSPLKQFPFGIRGLSAPTIEALYRRGLLQELEVHRRLKNPHAVQKTQSRRQVGHFARIPLYEDNIDAAQWLQRLPGATDTHLLSDMEEMETVLARRAQALGVDIRRGLGLVDFRQTDELVTVQSEGQSFQSQWLVGCDGSRSIVRKAGGFVFAGTEPEFTGYSVMVDIADPEKLSPGGNQTAAGMYLQSQPGYLGMLEFDGGASHNGAPITLEHIQAVLRRVSGADVTLRALQTATTWTDRARQATTYRKGRVLLAGDAAHIHSPLGGQGLNLGLGDAMNLGWKLAATLHGKAPDDLLDSYETERHPIGAQVLDWSRAQVAIMGSTPSSRALNAIIRDLMETRDGATYIAGRIWGIHTHYKLDGEHPLVGRSVPDFALSNGTKPGELMHDGRGMLLDFEMRASLNAVAAEYGDQVKYVAGPAQEQFGLSAVLIRPDGHVAWACEGDADAQSLRRSLATWFGR